MADGVTIPASGTGTATPVIATDDVNGAHHQYVKAEFGADGTATKVTQETPLPTAARAATATPTTVNGSVTSQTALAANANRLGALFFNDGDARCILYFGATASPTAVTVILGPGQFLALPAPIYTGRIDAVWESAWTAGNLYVTELT